MLIPYNKGFIKRDILKTAEIPQYLLHRFNPHVG